MRVLILTAAGASLVANELNNLGAVKEWKIHNIPYKHHYDIVFDLRNEITNRFANHDCFLILLGNQVGISLEEIAFALDMLLDAGKPILISETRTNSHYSFAGTALKSIKIFEHCYDTASRLGILVVDFAIHAARYLRQRNEVQCTSYPGPIGEVVRGMPYFYYTALPPSPKFLTLQRRQLKKDDNIQFIDNKFLDFNPVYAHIAQYFENSLNPAPIPTPAPELEQTQDLTLEADIDSFGLGYLPEEILLVVFSYLDIPSLARVERVCKMWNRVANDQYLGVELNFSATRPTVDKFYMYLKKSANVKRIDLSGCQSLTDDVLWNWNTERLASLKLRGCRWLKNSSSQAWLSSNFANLQELDISWGLNIHDLGLAKLLRATPVLKTLNISGCSRLTDKVLDLIPVCCPLLTSLDCSHCPMMTELCFGYLSNSVICDLKISISQKEDVNATGYPPIHSLKSITFITSSMKLSFYKLIPHLFPNLHKMVLSECRAVSELKLKHIIDIKQINDLIVTRCKGTNSLAFPDKKYINGSIISKESNLYRNVQN